MSFVVTIDGPAASGKSSVSRELARRLGWNWVSTGAFYRGLAYVASESGLDLGNPMRLAELARSSDWQVRLDEDRTRVLWQGRDVTDEINAEVIGNVASRISLYPEVREALLEAQRACAQRGPGLVAEGRDCGTVVFPEAPAKIYLTASRENRAARRAAEQGAELNRILEAQKERDQQDTTRKAAPLSVPAEAFVLDSSEMGFIEVVDAVEKFVRSRLPQRSR